MVAFFIFYRLFKKTFKFFHFLYNFTKKTMKASSIGFYAGITLFIIILIAPLSVTASIQVTLALAALMATWWLTEAVPIAVTSLLPLIILPLFGVMNGKEVAKMYANDIIFFSSAALW